MAITVVCLTTPRNWILNWNCGGYWERVHQPTCRRQCYGCCCRLHIYNDWSARDLQRQEMAVGLGPSKGKDFANALGPSVVPLKLLKDHYRKGVCTLR